MLEIVIKNIIIYQWFSSSVNTANVTFFQLFVFAYVGTQWKIIIFCFQTSKCVLNK